MLNQCYLCGDFLGFFSLKYYCEECHIIRRLLLLNGKSFFVEKVKQAFMKDIIEEQKVYKENNVEKQEEKQEEEKQEEKQEDKQEDLKKDEKKKEKKNNFLFQDNIKDTNLNLTQSIYKNN